MSTSGMIGNLYGYLRRSAERRPDATALVNAVSGRAITYAELLSGAHGAGALLRECGVGPGDKVALYLDNSCEYAACYFGILGIGAVVVPKTAAGKIDKDAIRARLRDSPGGGFPGGS